ncbi:MAG: zinc metalloprotease HtpX [Candidatus Aenigmarchaeota archaeon]|jgi:heat shock protein HtpX|nr:zinc metalloprotease HtpX [Candidatus Aenigmarchaeota archaeon]
MALKLVFSMFLTIALLFGLLFGILATIGYYFGISGYAIVLMALLLVFLQWYISPYIIMWTTNMQEADRKKYGWIYDMVEKICKKTKTPVPKKIFIVNSGAPNAFVFGRTPKSAYLAITRGLINTLDKEEIEAVIGHEMGHINHKDMVVMTVVAAIPVLAYFVARFLIFAPKESERRNVGAAILVGIIAYIIYFLSNLLVLYLSRLREFYADRFSGEHTNPRALARALAKITYGLSTSEDRIENSAVRSFFIADPITATKEISTFRNEYDDLEIDETELKKAMEWEKKNIFARVAEIFSTHPLTFKRIKALKELEVELKSKNK